MTAIMYQNAFLYNLIIRLLHKGYDDYKIIAQMIEGSSVLDLACASCIIQRFLPKNARYEGWELNNNFVLYCRKQGFNVRQKNVFDIEKENKKWDTIIIKDLLHHIYPKEKELLGLLKKRADYIIVCEPILNKKRFKDIIFGHKIFNFAHYFFGDFDSFNHFNSGRLFQKRYDKPSFLSMLGKFGKIMEQKQNKEMVIVKLKLRK